jgi:hypothetical protein
MSHYKILPGFPPYGNDLEIVSINQPPYSEGFIVQFFKDDGSTWIANFGTGFSSSSGVYEYPGNNLMVFAGGRGYAMDPNKKEPLNTFGYELKVIEVEKLRLACFEFDRVVVIEPDFTRWEITGLPFDDFKQLSVENGCVNGIGYNYIEQKDQPFTLDVNAREVLYTWQGKTVRAHPADEE